MGLTRITSDGITDGTIVNADINGSAAIAGSKLNTNFGSSGMTATGSCSFGNITISNVAPKIFLTDSDTDSDFSIRNMHGVFGIHDQTNSADRLTITSDGHIRIPTDNQQLQIGASQDLVLKHDGSNSYIQELGTGQLFIASNGGGVTIRANSGEASMVANTDGSVELYHDNSKKFETTSAGVKLGDNLKVEFGDDDDLEIYYHSSTDKNIINSLAPLRLLSDGNTTIESTSGEVMIKAVPDGGVQLYYDNSNMLETINGGARVNGVLHVTSHLDMNDSDIIKLGDDDDLQIYHDGTSSILKNTTGALYVQSDDTRIVNAANSETIARFIADGAVELYYNAGKKFETTSGGARITGILSSSITSGQAITLADGAEIHLGTGDDLKIYHDGSNSFIKDAGTGSLVIQASTLAVNNAAGSEQMMKAVENGAVELNYDGSKKLETTSVGAKISSSAAAKLNITSADNSSGMINLGPSSNDDSAQIWYDDYANGMFVRTTTNTSITVYTNNTQRLVLQNDGHLRPYVDSTYDLGTSSIRWRNVYADTYYGDGSNLTGINTDLVSDTSPQLGGSLDTNSKNINFGDSTGNGVNRIRMGASNDCQMYHDTNNTLIDNATGYLGIRSDTLYLQDHSNGHAYITAVRDGAVGLRYDNSQKLETTSSGVTVTGTCTATSFSGDGSNLSGVASFPSGTKMLFVQSSAPTGWTKQTGFDNRALRLVSSGSLGGGGGGSNGFSNVFNNSVSTSGGSVSNHTLSVSQIPSHNHTFSINNEYNQLFYPNQGIVARGENKSGIDTYSTSNTGSGSSHNHGFSNPSLNLNVSYVDVIYASKD